MLCFPRSYRCPYTCCFSLSLVNSLAYFGISFGMPLLSGNKYLNTFISGAVEVPAYIVCILCNRRCVCECMCVVCVVCVCVSKVVRVSDAVRVMRRKIIDTNHVSRKEIINELQMYLFEAKPNRQMFYLLLLLLLL